MVVSGMNIIARVLRFYRVLVHRCEMTIGKTEGYCESDGERSSSRKTGYVFMGKISKLFTDITNRIL